MTNFPAPPTPAELALALIFCLALLGTAALAEWAGERSELRRKAERRARRAGEKTRLLEAELGRREGGGWSWPPRTPA